MSALDDTLNSIKDDSLTDAKATLQNLLQQLKADSSKFAQDSAALVEQWLVELGQGKLTKPQFDDLIDEQRSAAQQFTNTETIAGTARARDLALNVLDIAAKKVGPALLASMGSGGKSADPS
jgi:hypothetical protein